MTDDYKEDFKFSAGVGAPKGNSLSPMIKAGGASGNKSMIPSVSIQGLGGVSG
jgi:hypothetical protein